MLLHSFLPVSRANGPGQRAVVFFQGCTILCQGCWNPKTHKFSGSNIPESEVLKRITTAMNFEALEGVTFSGGEPMDQPDALLDLILKIRGECPGLSLGMFTGYSEGELELNLPHLWCEISGLLDFAIMGRYERQLRSNRPLRTSANQRLVLFGDRYAEADFSEQLVEVSIAEDGFTSISGFPILGLPRQLGRPRLPQPPRIQIGQPR